MSEVEMQIRLQCLQMVDRSHVREIKEIIANAQAMYDFVMASQPDAGLTEVLRVARG